MSILWLTILIPLAGLVTYWLLPVLVEPVRIVFAWLLMAFLVVFAVVLQSRETAEISHLGKPPDTFDRSATSDQPTATDQDRTLDLGQMGYMKFQRISKEDHDFLDKILQKEYQASEVHRKPAASRVQSIRKVGIVGSGDELVLRAELVINSAEGKRPEAANHHETFKRPEPIRTRQ